jgi:GNAT superfamily N-acetyltransferase
MRVQDFRPGWRTDFIFHRAGAEVIERDDCVVVRTPGHEGFYWGNCLMIPETPADADLAHWLSRFEQEVAAGRPGVRHVAIAVNSAPPPDDALPGWMAAGFDIIETATMRLAPGMLRKPPAPDAEPTMLRPIDFATEIERFVELQASDPQGYEPEGYRHFCRRHLQGMARLHAAGSGQWFGLFCGDTLVADCGLMRDGTLGRFRSVLTHPQWRRRGLCHALVHGVCRWGIEHWGLTELLMCADPDDIAIGIYETLGFERFDREWGLQRNPPEDAAARRPVRLGSPSGDPA